MKIYAIYRIYESEGNELCPSQKSLYREKEAFLFVDDAKKEAQRLNNNKVEVFGKTTYIIVEEELKVIN